MSSQMLSTKLTNRLQWLAVADRRTALGLTTRRRQQPTAFALPLKSGGCSTYHALATARSVRPLDNWSRMIDRSHSFISYSRSLSIMQGRDWRAALSELWRIQKPKEGSGFENFIPKKKSAGGSEKKESSGSNSDGNKEAPKEKPKSGDTSSKNQTKKDSDPFKNFGAGGPFRSQNNQDSGNNNNNNFNSSGAVTSAAILLFLSYMMMKMSDSSRKHDDSHEIDWKEFIYGLVETDQVDKVVISPNRTSALVFLKPGARGLPNDRHALRRTDDGTMHDTSATHHEEEEDMVEGLSSSSSSQLHSSTNQGFSVMGHRIVYRLNIGSVDMFERKLQEAQRGLGRSPSHDIPVQFVTESSIAAEVFKVLPGLMMLGLIYFASRSMLGGSGFGSSSGGGSEGGGGGIGGIFKIGRSTAQKIGKDDIKVRFSDVAGCDEAKKEIMEFVQFLQDPTLFTKLGAKIPKGALLCGPPGTGKTLLAKAVAGEAGVPFYSISGSNFVEMFVGVGPARVRDLFRDARKDAPCIIFIDEIDAVGRKRSRGGVGNDESENTLNQLLVEMDGFSPSSGVVVLAATNRVDILDQALVRPGRFDRQVLVDKPDLKGRRQIFMVHLKELTLADEMEDIAGRLAGLTPGFVGADIANICNESAIIAARRSADAVALEDFEKAIDRNIGGMESNKIMSKDERNIVAHHEAGHAVAGWFLEHADPLMKVTIIPRSNGALGFAQYLPKEVFLRSQDQIMDIVCMALAGRAAEEVFFGSVTTGASDDLRRVTDIVYNMIQVFGMNPRLGQLAFPKDPNAMWDERPYSEKTAQAMDEEAKTLVDAAYKKTLELIREKKDAVEKVASLLLSQETITHDDIVDLIGPRPFVGDATYNEFIHGRKPAVPTPDASEESSSEESNEATASTTKEGELNPGLA